MLQNCKSNMGDVFSIITMSFIMTPLCDLDTVSTDLRMATDSGVKGGVEKIRCNVCLTCLYITWR